MCSHAIEKTCTNCGEQFCVRCNPGVVCQKCTDEAANNGNQQQMEANSGIHRNMPANNPESINDYPVFLNFERVQ